MLSEKKAIEEQIELVLDELRSLPRFRKFIDFSLRIPRIFRGTGRIRLIILGQDPTIKNAARRSKITMVLNLDKPRAIKKYLTEVCNHLGLSLEENVYATNYFKNFFIKPPTTAPTALSRTAS